jgi:hypothetical protein
MKPRTFLALTIGRPLSGNKGQRRFVFKVYKLSKLRQRQVDLLATKMWRERAPQLEVDKPSARAKVLPFVIAMIVLAAKAGVTRLPPIAERKS